MKSNIPYGLVLLCLFLSSSSNAQDTLSVFFPFGKSKTNLQPLEKLLQSKVFHDSSQYRLDSINVIGMPDSVGKLQANERLADKRASFVANHLEMILPQRILINTRSKGETVSKSTFKSRRVDVLVFSTAIEQKQEVTSRKNKCFTIDYELLNTSWINEQWRGRNRYMSIESDQKEVMETSYYYGAFNKRGKLIPKPVVWTIKRTGRKWWAERRYVATIPIKAYKATKVFTISTGPCDSCAQSFFKDSLEQKDTTPLFTDDLLMDHVQYRRLSISSKVSVRAPEEFINKRYKYYSGCDTIKPLKWRRKFFFWNRDYLFTELRVRGIKVDNISRRMTMCEPSPTLRGCNVGRLCIDPMRFTSRGIMLLAETGCSKMYPKGYISIGVEKDFQLMSYSLSFGKYHEEYLLAAQARIHFVSAPMMSLKRWKTKDELKPVTRFFRSYIGTEANFGKADLLKDQNIHVGLSYFNTTFNGFFKRAFLQYEWRFERKDRKLLGQAQLKLGISFRLLVGSKG